MRGRFIVFEGIDGSGKSTAIAHVAAQMQAAGHEVVLTREETAEPTGTLARQSIADGMDPLATTYLFLADRAQHVPWIEAHLAAGRHVLCDRFIHSTMAYQSVTLAGKIAEPAAMIAQLHAPIALRPDHVILMQARASICVARAAARGETTRYEKAQFLEQVAAAYDQLAATDARIVCLDAEAPLEAVCEAATKHVAQWLPQPA